ncbi:thioredoxin domain-containing protein [Nocardioides dubius]|uniref:Thioredoxin domain-containing protein n=1 Tax=Nocardioides dubius TaxID=317019 RepID=A0ABN1TYU0_9ACTN
MNQPAQGKRNLIIGGIVVAVIALIVGIGWAVQANRDTTGDDAKTPGASSTPSETTTPSETPSETPSTEPSTSPSTTPSTAPPATSAPVTGPTDADGNVRVALVDEFGMGVGDPEAPVKIEIFEDFQCPHCRDLEEVMRQDLLDAALSGKAFVVYRPMAFLNDYSVKAMNAVGVVLDSGNGAAALALHDTLFAQQPSGSIPSNDWFVEQAVAAGADKAKVADAIKGLEFKQWVVNATDDASKRGVTGTPTVFVDGDVVSGGSVEEMANNILAKVG